jgi:hypothetical protein
MGKFRELGEDIIREILSWASIVELHNILLLDTSLSRQAKQCGQWEKLQIMPIPRSSRNHHL